MSKNQESKKAKVVTKKMERFLDILVCDCGGDMEFAGYSLSDYAIHKCKKCDNQEAANRKYPYEYYKTVE